MTDPQVALLMLGILLFAIMLGFPIAFTLIAMGVGFGFYAYYNPDIAWFHNNIFDLLVNQTYSVMTSDVLVAVPLFLFMGYVVERANIVDRLFFSLNIAARAIPAPMAVAALATCALFATAVGIIGAVVTLMGLLAFPALLKAGYDTKFSAGVICAGGCLGILIPPSIMLIVYAATTAISVVQAYAAAIFPGLMLAGLYMIYVVIRALINPKLAPKPPKEQVEMPMREVIWMMITSFVPLAVLIMAVLGAILFGWASPTEAAGVGAFGGLFLAACYRSLSWQMLRESVYLTVRTSAMVCWLFVGSWTFSSVFSYLGGEGLIEEFVIWLELSPLMFLIVAQIIIFLLGWPLEWSEIIIIFVPIFLPLLELFNIDPLFFGILVALNLQTSFMTPPMAMAAYYLKGVSPPHVQLMDIFRGCFPFLGIVILAMVILYNFPGIALWLPEQIYKVR
ncbi:MAG: TRAP transporter large permease subunit [Gammaproteobacteria bacterium]|nr:TRAP transporter large permease subunit [Gammaproteobacteria bacterium]